MTDKNIRPGTPAGKDADIRGQLEMPAEWTVFAPFPADVPELPDEWPAGLPETVTVGVETRKAVRVCPTRGQLDFRPFFGEPPYDTTRAALVFVVLDSPADQSATLGFGADWFLQAWLDGRKILDTLADGNGASPPSIGDHRVTARLRAGRNLVAVRLLHGTGGALLAFGGPPELRRGDFRSILPPRPRPDLAALYREYPPDPAAPLRWAPPARFDPNAPDLGLPLLAGVEHVELMHALPSRAAFEDGGAGTYESLRHGTWNHGPRLTVFQDRLLATWNNHSVDEGAPGARILARVGRITGPDGQVDWGDEADGLLEPAPAPVPVRRRRVHAERDAVRGVIARGAFQPAGGRLLFLGHLVAKHGVTTDRAFNRPAGPVPAAVFHFGRGPHAPRGGFIEWDLGFRFCQEWAVRDGRLRPGSPLYREDELPARLALTPGLSLPVEPLTAAYRDAAPLAEAPADFQALVREARRAGYGRKQLRYQPGTGHLAHDGLDGLVHSTEFQRPDGAWVAIRENQYPRVQPFYYAAEKPDTGSYYPPARRTNLFGAVNPDAGELPGGRVYIIGNSPNRRTMFIALSADGRLFDRTWFLLYRQLSDYTPGEMKREGGPGSGPQYFASAVAGQSLWIVYSISKEHVGATRVPLAALDGKGDER